MTNIIKILLILNSWDYLYASETSVVVNELSIDGTKIELEIPNTPSKNTLAVSAGSILHLDKLPNGHFGKNISYWKSDLSIEQVILRENQSEFIRCEKEIVTLGNSKEKHWFRFTVQNSDDTAKQFYLYNNNLRQTMKIYDQNGLKLYQWSKEERREERLREFVVPPESSQVFYISIKNPFGPLSFNWRIFENELKAIEYLGVGKFRYTIFVASIITCSVVNLMLLFSFRKKVYLYYQIYLLASLLYLSWYDSFIYLRGLFFYPYGSTMTLAGFFITLFTYYFFELESNRFKKISLYVKFHLTVFATVFFISFFYRSVELAQIGSALGSIYPFLGLYITIKTRELHFAIFTVAITFFVFCYMFVLLGFIGAVKLIPQLQHIGTMGENIIMLLAVTYKVYSTEKSRIAAHKELKHTYKQLSKIVYPHQITLIQNGSQLESTMKTIPDSGVVISFDIIGSSKLIHPRLKDFLESSIHDCMEILSENYSEEKMTANGYRIKEMGDGFLCSIGYPFKIPEQIQASDLAVSMSNRFIKNLEMNVKKFSLNQNVYCGIGIAMGELHGYYPKSGTIEYDLFGRGIILATRYESMRKMLFPNANSHVVILQKSVYDSLSNQVKKAYKKHDLSDEVKVRDDEQAEELYYNLVTFGLVKDFDKTA